MTVNADWFGGIGDASESGAGNWFRRGVYVAEVVRITQKVSEDPMKNNARLVIAEFRIRGVVSAYPAEGESAASQNVGELAAAMFDMSSAYKSMHLGRLKSLIAAAIGDTAEIVGDDAWKALAAKVTAPPGEMLAGNLVLVDCSSPTTTKRNRKVIYPARFSSLSEELAAQYEAEDEEEGAAE